MWNDDKKVTFRELNDRINQFKSREFKQVEDHMKALTQMFSMLCAELGYSLNSDHNGIVTINKVKKSK